MNSTITIKSLCQICLSTQWHTHICHSKPCPSVLLNDLPKDKPVCPTQIHSLRFHSKKYKYILKISIQRYVHPSHSMTHPYNMPHLLPNKTQKKKKKLAITKISLKTLCLNLVFCPMPLFFLLFFVNPSAIFFYLMQILIWQTSIKWIQNSTDITVFGYNSAIFLFFTLLWLEFVLVSDLWPCRNLTSRVLLYSEVVCRVLNVQRLNWGMSSNQYTTCCYRTAVKLTRCFEQPWVKDEGGDRVRHACSSSD